MAGATNPNAAGDPDRFVGLGERLGEELRVLLVVAPYYRDVADALEAGARAELEKAGVEVDRVEVPGALEIPQALQMQLLSNRGALCAGAIIIGCVVRGETSHYDIVCNTANHFATDVALRAQVPLGNALLTVDTHAQAMARAKTETGGKGGDAARAILTLIELEHQIRAQDDADDSEIFS